MPVHSIAIKRKKVKHYNIPNHAHELTFSCYHNDEYLLDPVACGIFMEELEDARKEFGFRIWAYVLMPEHVHLLIYPTKQKYNISKILKSVKGAMSARYRNYLKETDIV